MHSTAVIVYGINIFAFVSVSVFDDDVESIDGIFFSKNGRTSKLTNTAPTPYPNCTVFNGAAAFAPHIVNKTLFPPVQNNILSISTDISQIRNLPKSVNP